MTREAECRCDGVRRRDVLKLGVLSCLGLSLADCLRLQAAAAPGRGAGRRDLSCILIWLDGGPSHLDTFDLKPEAPAEVRGEFKPIATKADGVQICEHLPRTAQVMDRVALIRSLTHELGNHDTGSHYLLTGHRPTPVLEYPEPGEHRGAGDGLRCAPCRPTWPCRRRCRARGPGICRRRSPRSPSAATRRGRATRCATSSRRRGCGSSGWTGGGRC